MTTNPTLAPVFLDSEPVDLEDAKPQLNDILAAVGKPETTQVQWLTSESSTQGRRLRGEEVVDRTRQPEKPIYLTSAKPGSEQRGWGASMDRGEHAAAPARQEKAPDLQTEGSATDLQTESQGSKAPSGDAARRDT